MNFDNESRTRIFADVTVTIDPSTGTTVELKVDGAWHAADWVSTAVHRPPMGELPERWLRRARTVDYFAGLDMGAPAGATVLAKTRHATQVRLSKDGDVIVGHASVIDVVD